MRSAKGRASRMLSMGAFAALWLIVCTAAAAAAIEFPITRFLRPGGMEHGAGPDAGTADNADNAVSTGGIWHFSQNGTIFGSEPELFDGGCMPPRESASEEMLAPIDAVCRFVSNGDTEALFKAVHPEFAKYIKRNYGAAIDFLDGDAVLGVIAGRIFGDDAGNMPVGTVEYEVCGIRSCNAAVLRRIERNAEAWASGLNVSEAVKIDLKLKFVKDEESFGASSGDGGEYFSCSPTLYRTPEGWFIDAAG